MTVRTYDLAVSLRLNMIIGAMALCLAVIASLMSQWLQAGAMLVVVLGQAMSYRYRLKQVGQDNGRSLRRF